jgi:RNA recognition motif-containing protein
VKGVNDFFYAFIEFDKPEEAAQALKEMDQQELAGKRLSIKFAKARETRPYSTSRPFYGDIKPRENKFDNYRHSPRGRSHSRERGMERYSYGMNERMYSRERREMRDNRDMRDLRDRRDERDSMRYSRDDMSREMNREIPREMNREMNRDLSREMPREMNREINTIGSKNQFIEIAEQVINAKDALENIREQSKNIE